MTSKEIDIHIKDCLHGALSSDPIQAAYWEQKLCVAMKTKLEIENGIDPEQKYIDASKGNRHRKNFNQGPHDFPECPSKQQ